MAKFTKIQTSSTPAPKQSATENYYSQQHMSDQEQAQSRLNEIMGGRQAFAASQQLQRRSPSVPTDYQDKMQSSRYDEDSQGMFKQMNSREDFDPRVAQCANPNIIRRSSSEQKTSIRDMYDTMYGDNYGGVYAGTGNTPMFEATRERIAEIFRQDIQDQIMTAESERKRRIDAGRKEIMDEYGQHVQDTLGSESLEGHTASDLYSNSVRRSGFERDMGNSFGLLDDGKMIERREKMAHRLSSDKISRSARIKLLPTTEQTREEWQKITRSSKFQDQYDESPMFSKLIKDMEY